jgi:Domain of unknown function (DUF4276)
VKIAILVEGKTETAFKRKLLEFLSYRLQGKMPKLSFKPQFGRIPKEEKLKRMVDNFINNDGFEAVIALTDVYTGTNDFSSASDAKSKMKTWVGDNLQFYPHAAAHDFEAWLLPYWSTIQKKANNSLSQPSGAPETVNHNRPPSKRINEIYRKGLNREYDKIRDGITILKDNDLMVAIQVCPELKSFINTIINLCDPSKVIP